VKAAPVGLEGRELERMLTEVIEQTGRPKRRFRPGRLATLRGRIAASIACHSAIKVNTPLESQKMDWLLKELSKTEFPTSCPHGRPIALRYSWKEIQRAFQRIYDSLEGGDPTPKGEGLPGKYARSLLLSASPMSGFSPTPSEN
jgi:DNA mismatch repair protein MutL